MTNVFYDYETSNESFLITVKELKDQGIGNHEFPLTLYNEKLIGIDPHDPSISPRQKESVREEAMSNIWYFLRECVRIPFHFELNRASATVAYLTTKNISSFVNTPRLTHRTNSTLAILTWHLLASDQSTNDLILMSAQHEDALENMSSMNIIMRTLPNYFLDGFEINKSPSVRTAVAPGTYEEAKLIGLRRNNISYYDNFESMRHTSSILRNSEIANMTYKKQFDVDNVSSFRVFTSVENGVCQGIIDDMIQWDDSLYDYDDITKLEGHFNIFHIRYNYTDLRRSDIERMLMNNQSTIAKELLIH